MTFTQPPEMRFPDGRVIDSADSTLEDLGTYEFEWDAELLLAQHELSVAQRSHDADAMRTANARSLHARTMIALWSGFHRED
jgi:hypothetical protein